MKRKKSYPVWDFSHNYTPTRIKCPVCLELIKPASHVRSYKTVAGVWMHIKYAHRGLTDEKLDEIKEKLKKVSRNMNGVM